MALVLYSYPIKYPSRIGLLRHMYLFKICTVLIYLISTISNSKQKFLWLSTMLKMQHAWLSRDLTSRDFYRPKTKFGEVNVFSHVSVHIGWVFLDPCHFFGVSSSGTMSPLGVISRERALLTPQTWDLEGWGGGTQPDRHGIQWDTVNKRTVRILLECFLLIGCMLLFTGALPMKNHNSSHILRNL